MDENPGDGQDNQGFPPAPTRNAPMLGMEDLLMGERGKATFNVPKELLQGSDKPYEYMGRTEVTDEEIETFSQVDAIMQRCIYRFIDPGQIYKGIFNLRMSLNRKSREEAVDVAKAENKSIRQRFQDRIFGARNDNIRQMPGGNI